MTSLLSIDRLTIGHRGHALLSDATCALEAGQMAALIGLNGSGKSTLLRALAGLHPLMQGRVLLEGKDLGGHARRDRAQRLSFVLSGRPRIGLMDVRALVAMGRQPWTGAFGGLGASDQRQVEEALERTGLKPLADRQFDSLSDGEAQKAMIALAIAQDTPVILLDEPTAHLDVLNRVEVLRLLRGIARDQQRCVLLSTHDLSTALDLCDRVLLLHQGALWCGSPHEARSSGRLAAAFQQEGLLFDPVAGILRPME